MYPSDRIALLSSIDQLTTSVLTTNQEVKLQEPIYTHRPVK